jgi:peptidoglycan-associated lipoprotein
MMVTTTRRLALTALVVSIALLTGCSKKAVEKPPTPPAPPPTTTTPSQPPPTPPAETTTPTPPSSKISASDFEPAFFDLDSYALRDDARTALDHDAKVLRANGDVKITIEGHCDERGTVEYNQALGEKRAQAAREYLTAAGIDGSRINTVSYGKERPFDQGHDESAWAKNRRAHIVTP